MKIYKAPKNKLENVQKNIKKLKEAYKRQSQKKQTSKIKKEQKTRIKKIEVQKDILKNLQKIKKLKTEKSKQKYYKEIEKLKKRFKKIGKKIKYKPIPVDFSKVLERRAYIDSIYKKNIKNRSIQFIKGLDYYLRARNIDITGILMKYDIKALSDAIYYGSGVDGREFFGYNEDYEEIEDSKIKVLNELKKHVGDRADQLYLTKVIQLLKQGGAVYEDITEWEQFDGKDETDFN